MIKFSIMPKKVLISGIPPSNGGVGRLMKILVPCAKEHGYSIIYRREKKSLRRFLEKGHILLAAKELLERKIDNLIFHLRSMLIKESVVLALHPQTIGFNTFNKVIRRNAVYFYVMDNSFFCLRSYNINPLTNTECLICLSNSANALDQCIPFPVRYEKEENITYLEKLKSLSQEVFFLAQNKKQKELLQMHFGKEINCSVVGLDTGEMDFQSANLPTAKLNVTSYDLVYHGVGDYAKGVGYFVELAILLPEFSCFLPCSRVFIENIIGRKIEGKNIIFNECTWETGLKDAVASARLVINPSLWSAPIEGALLKSIYFNGNVAVVETQYGFSLEVASDSDILCLPLNTIIAANKIRCFLHEGSDNSRNTRKWLNDFLLKNNINNIFDSILYQQKKTTQCTK